MLGMLGDRLRKWLRTIPSPVEGDGAAETTALHEPSGTAASSNSAADGHDHTGSENAAVTGIDSPVQQTTEQTKRTETLIRAPDVIETRGDSQNAE